MQHRDGPDGPRRPGGINDLGRGLRCPHCTRAVPLRHLTLTYVDRSGRGPDTAYNYWISDDETIRLPEVILDGAVNASVEAATLYRPSDLLNSVGVPTVRTESRAENRSVLPWIGCAAIAAVSFIAFRVVRGMRREQREAAAAGPPPKQFSQPPPARKGRGAAHPRNVSAWRR